MFPSSVWGIPFADLERQDLPYKNWIKNPEFENGKQGWTVSGGDTFALVGGTSARNLGRNYITWDSAGASRVLTHTAVTMDYSSGSRNGLCEYTIAVASGTATHLIRVYDGTNVLASATVTSSTIATTSSVSVVLPANVSTAQCQLISVAADEPSIAVLSSYLGFNYQVGQVSQAEVYGTLIYAGTANCYWTGATTAAFTSSAADTDCPTPTVVGNATAPSTKIPGVTFTSLPPGRYEVEMTATIDFGGTDTVCGFRVFDGTTGGPSARTTAAGSTGASPVALKTKGVFTYTTAQGSTTFQAQTYESSGTDCFIAANVANSSDFSVTVTRFPLASEQAFRPDVGPSSWSGFHSSNCSFARTDTAYGDPATDASCTFTERTNRNFGTVTGANNLPSITFTPTRSGFFRVCAQPTVAGSTAAATIGLRLWDGTTTIAESDWQTPTTNHGSRLILCGQYNATNTTSKTFSLQIKSSTGAATITNLTAASVIEWEVQAIDFSMNASMLVGSTTNTGTGAIRLEGARLNCDSASAITSQVNGSSWISSIGNISAGACAVTITTGIFSAAPVCTLAVDTGAGGDPIVIGLTTAPTTTALSVDAADNAGTDSTAFDFEVICVGAR